MNHKRDWKQCLPKNSFPGGKNYNNNIYGDGGDNLTEKQHQYLHLILLEEVENSLKFVVTGKVGMMCDIRMA